MRECFNRTGDKPDSDKNYGYPMLSNLVVGEKLGCFFNEMF